jgi:hypothetical protein
MVVKKAPGPSVDELVTKALVTLATADGPVRLSGKGDPPALFPSAAGTNKEAIARLKDESNSLLAVVGSGKTATVRLTAAGFRYVLPHLPEEKVGGAAKALASELPTGERVEFLNEVVRRTPVAAAELLPMLEEAVAAEKAETEARIAATARRRQAEEATRKAIERWNQLLAERQAQRVTALRKQLEAEGAEVPPALPNVSAPDGDSRQPEPPSLLVPATREDVRFRREVAGRLVSAWLESYRLNKPEGRLFLETAMGNISGFRQIGEEGERVHFDGKYHECDTGVSTGAQVRVVRPGWVLEEEDGEYRLVPAKVAP